ncbi:MAG: hypothetical protein ABFD97_00450 [Syntrophobacter sp.]
MGKNTASEQVTLDTTVSAKELAIVLGLSIRRIQQLVQDGIFEAVEKGKYNLAKSVSRYINLNTKEQSESDKQRAEAEISIKKAKAIVAVMEAKELQGKMHRSEDVAAMTEDLIFAIRGMLIALPGRLAVDTSTTKTPAEAAEIIRQEVYKVMEELSHYQYDPQKYEERVRERRKWDTEGGGADGED